MSKLKARGIATLAAGRHGDGDGLYLNVTPSQTHSWVFRWKRAAKVKEMGLGPWPLVTLAEARQKATEARRLLLGGVDPLDSRRASIASRHTSVDIPSFGQAADALIADMEPGWRNAKHKAQWRMTLGDSYCSALRRKRVDQVTTEDVLAILKPIWLSKSETASRLRGRIASVLDWAKAKGHISKSEPNVAIWHGHLSHLLPKQNRLSRRHLAALPFEEMATFMAELRTREGMAAQVLQFLILTAARSGEVRLATWSEIDIVAKVWTVPANRMKAQREHRVPLSNRALAILESVRPLSGNNPPDALVFPSSAKPGRPLSDMSLSAVLRRMHRSETVHGFRSSFRDWCGEATDFPREVAEAALAHVVGDRSERSYRRGDALQKRRLLMDSWAAFCEPAPAELRESE